MIRRFQNLNEQTVLVVLVVVAVSSLAMSFISHWLDGSGAWWGWADSAFQNFSTEMMGAVLTFGLFELILGAKKEAKEKAEAEQAEKQRLVIELRNKNNATALNALEQIRARGWDSDGTLGEVPLGPANLRESHLNEANLEGAYLSQADFRDAHLLGANLSEAVMIQTNLKGVILLQANPQRACLYQANLEGARLRAANLQGAFLMDANLQDALLLEAIFDNKTVLPDAEFLQDADGNKLRDESDEFIYTKYWTPDTDMMRYTDPNHPDFWQPDWVKEQNN